MANPKGKGAERKGNMYAKSAFGPREEPIESTTETISPDMVMSARLKRNVLILALNTGTDAEGDNSSLTKAYDPVPRRAEVSQTSTVLSDDIISPDESASLVLSTETDSRLSLSPVIRRNLMPPKCQELVPEGIVLVSATDGPSVGTVTLPLFRSSA
ncbi:hypothetical protein V1521DRAFT_450931 [Lipomyces starkeyi]